MRRPCTTGLLALLLLATLGSASALAADPVLAFGGGGVGIGALFTRLDEINAFAESTGYPSLDGAVFLIGGGGRGGVAPGIAIGGAGFGAWIESEDNGQHTEFSLGLGGFDLGFAVAGSSRSVLACGAWLGGGAAELALTELPPTDPLSLHPQGIIPEPTRQTYDAVFGLVAPYVDMEVGLLNWMGLGVQIGFVWCPFELNWYDEGSLDPPALAPFGPYVRISVVFGGIVDLRPKAGDAQP